MKLIATVLLAACAVILTGCATKSTQPTWFVGDDIKYSRDKYLLGRGQASTLEEAKYRARADLAQIFQVAIKVASEEVQRYMSTNTALGSGNVSENYLQRLNTFTEQVLKGIQIAEIWQNKADNSFAVLAVLPRLQAEESLRQQIGQLDEGVRINVVQAKSNADVLVKIASANKAIYIQLEREGLQRALQVIDVTGRGIESLHNSLKLKIVLDELRKQVRISFKVLGGSVPGLDEVVSGTLSHAGFTVDSVEPVFLLKASLRLTDLGIIDGWYWQRGSLEISVSETATGRVRGAQRWPIKSNGRDRALAIRKALDETSEVLRKDLGSTITGMADVK